jgi:glucose-6-phosphate 1-dehydrogenase
MNASLEKNDMEIPENHVIVLFGATGDLAKRKILPGLYHLAQAGLLPERYRIIGSGRAASALSSETFRAHARESILSFGTTKPEGDAWETFEQSLSYVAADADHYDELVAAVKKAEDEIGPNPRRHWP